MYTNINHYVAHLKLTECYMSIKLQLKKERKSKSHPKWCHLYKAQNHEKPNI